MKLQPGGAWLAVAAVTFWISWWLMPGVGITDAQTIFTLVGAHRGQVLASSVLQLFSAACYAPALVALAGARPALRGAAILLLIGAMGSSADAIFHQCAYEMTAPGAPAEALLPVMTRMQGPSLVWILPLIVCFFAGTVWLVVAARREEQGAGARGVWIGLGVLIAALAAAAALGRIVPGRAVGLSVLALVSASQLRVALTGPRP